MAKPTEPPIRTTGTARKAVLSLAPVALALVPALVKVVNVSSAASSRPEAAALIVTPPCSEQAMGPASSAQHTAGERPNGCAGLPLSVKFYDVGQALSVLLSLPDGRHVLVDTGEQRTRCGAACTAWSEHLLSALSADVAGQKLALLWITHQHSDHAGNAADILRRFDVASYVDNGSNLDSTVIKNAREAAAERDVTVQVVDPEHRDFPLAPAGGLKFTPVLPSKWGVDCEDSPNNCSLGLRVDYCNSSVLFTGDAEEIEEAELDTRGPATLLQVGHHGSDTSSSAAFIKRVAPKYAVISSGKVDEGTNTGYCHPRLSTIEALSASLGGRRTGEVRAFDGAVKCKDPGHAEHWRGVSTSDHLWLTERDGDVELVTTGDGVFQRVARRKPQPTFPSKPSPN